MIKIENLQKSYDGQLVLDKIQLKLHPGRVYGLVGENGSGKTTLFKCISGLESFEGRIECDSAHLKNQLGYLQTEPFFFPKITGREYLQLLCNARRLPPINFDTKNIFELPLDHYAITYSTGMKKKLALTAILLQQNAYFILDEPYNGVDIQSNLMITEIIHELRKLNKTILISSHIFSTLRDTCDEIHVLQNGKLVRNVLRDEFDQLENDMKAFSIGNRIARLELQ